MVFGARDLVAIMFGLRRIAEDPVDGGAILVAAVAHAAFLLQLVSRRLVPPGLRALGAFSAGAWAGAVIPTAGGHFEEHYWALFILSAPAMGLAAWRLAFAATTPSGLPLPRFGGPPVQALAVSTACLVGFGVLLSSPLAARLFPAVLRGQDSVHVAALGAGLTRAQAADWQQVAALAPVLEACRVDPAHRVLETYPSLVGIALGARPMPEAVSVIHVLGAAARERFTRAIAADRPVLATTIAPDYSIWAAWILRARWFWYRQVLAGYRPVARTDQHIIWLRDAGAVPVPAAGQCRIEQPAPNRVRLHLTPEGTGRPRLGVATLAYRSLPQGGGPTRPLRTLVTIAEVETIEPPPIPPETSFLYGVPAGSPAEEVPFVPADSGASVLELRSLPASGSALDGLFCGVAFFPYDVNPQVPRITDVAELAAQVRAVACAGQ